MPERRAYLDHAATTPLRPEAAEAMRPHLSGEYGNPSGGHHESRRARRAVDDAREHVAALLGADLGEVVFTSGGTEADNLAVTGGWKAVAAGGPSPPGIVCAAFEHHAVLETCRALARESGAELREVPADRCGLVDPGALAEACTPDVGPGVGDGRQQRGRHGPAARASWPRSSGPGRRGRCCTPTPSRPRRGSTVGPLTRAFDLVSVSAHKFGGPQGVGALVVRHGTGLVAQATGGGQERERRSGTHNVAGIVAMAAALGRAVEDQARDNVRVGALRDRLADGLLAAVPGTAWTGSTDAAPGFCHLRFAGLESEALVLLLDQAGVAVSAGAACSSGAVEASHVLVGHGLRPVRGHVRHPLLPGVDHHRRGHRPGPVGRPGRRRPAARLIPCACWWPCRAASTPRWRPPCWPTAGRDQVVGATLKLWGGESDSGCCSVADVEDARRVAEQLGIVHHVFNFADDFEDRVVDPYVRGHAEGRTPNPCIECNRHLKFDRLLERAGHLGFDAVATGHHARRAETPDGRFRLCRGADRGQGPVLRAVHAGPGPAGPGGVPGRGADQGRGPGRGRGGGACARRPSPTARTSASSARTEGRAGSWPIGSRSIRAGWSTTGPAPTSGRSRRSSW